VPRKDGQHGNPVISAGLHPLLARDQIMARESIMVRITARDLITVTELIMEKEDLFMMC